MKRSNRFRQRGRSLIGLLFGLLFAGAGGLFLVNMALVDLLDWQRMAAWQPVDAEILEASISGGETQRVTARYRYRFDGRDYPGERVGISRDADNIGRWQQETYRNLEQARREGVRIRAWVDPGNPGDAVIDREIRWGLMVLKLGLPSIFVIVGLVVAGASLRRWRAKPASSTTTPWRERAEWQGGTIRSDAMPQLKGLLLFALLWNAIALPAPFLAFDQFMAGDHAVALVLVFPLIGLGILYFVLRRLLEWQRFGPTPLTLNPLPGSIGGKVAGHIDIRLPYSDAKGITATLRCIHTYTTGSGKNRTTHHDTLWESSQPARIEPGMQGVRAGFSFTTPGNLPPASPHPAGDRYRWELGLRAELRGIDLDRSFDIPVFDTGEGNKEKVFSASEAALEVDDPTARVELDPGKIVIKPHAGGTQLYFPPLRSGGLGFGLLLFGLVFGGSVFAIELFGHGGVPLPALFIFGGIGSLLILAGLYTLGNSLEVIAGRSGITTTRRILGIPLRSTIAIPDITRFERRVTMSSKSGSGKRTNHLSLFATTRDGRRHTVADTLPNAKTADHLLGLIERATGYRGEHFEEPERGNDRLRQRLTQSGRGRNRMGKVVVNLIALIVIVSFFWELIEPIARRLLGSLLP